MRRNFFTLILSPQLQLLEMQKLYKLFLQLQLPTKFLDLHCLASRKKIFFSGGAFARLFRRATFFLRQSTCKNFCKSFSTLLQRYKIFINNFRFQFQFSALLIVSFPLCNLLLVNHRHNRFHSSCHRLPLLSCRSLQICAKLL